MIGVRRPPLFFAGAFSTLRDLVFCLMWTGALWSLSPSHAESLFLTKRPGTKQYFATLNRVKAKGMDPEFYILNYVTVKQISEVDGILFTSSLNICSESSRRNGFVAVDISFTDDVTTFSSSE